MSAATLHHVLEGAPDLPMLVLGNSLGTSLAMWDRVAPRLRDQFRLVRYDHRGQGASAVPEGPYAIDDLGGDVIAMLDALGIDRATYCGVSIGGMVGLWLAARAPERIVSLIAFCTSAHPGNPQAWAERAATVRAAASTAPIADAVVQRWLTPEFAAAHPEVRDELRAMILASPPSGYAACCAALERLDLRPELPGIRIPVLVVGAAQDTSLPAAEHCQPIAAAIPGARYELLDRCAHIPMAERPGEVARLIGRHLALSRPAPA